MTREQRILDELRTYLGWHRIGRQKLSPKELTTYRAKIAHTSKLCEYDRLGWSGTVQGRQNRLTDEVRAAWSKCSYKLDSSLVWGRYCLPGEPERVEWRAKRRGHATFAGTPNARLSAYVYVHPSWLHGSAQERVCGGRLMVGKDRGVVERVRSPKRFYLERI